MLINRFTRNLLISFCLSLVLALPLAFSGDYPIVHGEVVKITDGDTVNLAPYDDNDDYLNVAPLKLRFLHIDAPELHVQDTAGRWVKQGHWGSDATDMLTSLMPMNSTIRIEDHGLDVWKRTLAKLFYVNKNINLAMVKAGWAVPYIYCAVGECYDGYLEDEHVESYYRACRSARSQGLGIWNPKDPLPEYPFEFRLRVQGRAPDKFMGDYTTGDLYSPGNYDQVDICNSVFFHSQKDAEALGFRLVY